MDGLWQCAAAGTGHANACDIKTQMPATNTPHVHTPGTAVLSTDTTSWCNGARCLCLLRVVWSGDDELTVCTNCSCGRRLPPPPPPPTCMPMSPLALASLRASDSSSVACRHRRKGRGRGRRGCGPCRGPLAYKQSAKHAAEWWEWPCKRTKQGGQGQGQRWCSNQFPPMCSHSLVPLCERSSKRPGKAPSGLPACPPAPGGHTSCAGCPGPPCSPPGGWPGGRVGGSVHRGCGATGVEGGSECAGAGKSPPAGGVQGPEVQGRRDTATPEASSRRSGVCVVGGCGCGGSGGGADASCRGVTHASPPRPARKQPSGRPCAAPVPLRCRPRPRPPRPARTRPLPAQPPQAWRARGRSTCAAPGRAPRARCRPRPRPPWRRLRQRQHCPAAAAAWPAPAASSAPAPRGRQSAPRRTRLRGGGGGGAGVASV